MGFVDVLLSNELPAAEERTYKIKRLSRLWKTDVTLRLRGLSYNKVAEIKRMDPDNMSLHIILAGDAEGVFKNDELMRKFNAPTPAELVKRLLTAGEIEDIAVTVERLSGYRQNTIEEIKKN